MRSSGRLEAENCDDSDLIYIFAVIKLHIIGINPAVLKL